MSRDLLTALCLVLLVATASAYASYRYFRFTPDDQWHVGFSRGYGACHTYYSEQGWLHITPLLDAAGDTP